ncbi:hypothetical protein [Candidatus Arsenophonus triatominarum]|uniref:hypothetical protein n=1 Tax=Candidatus Arsenophonus triatominarum TaxID=57911 RepID=UPI000A57BC75|nr:hypothetical protein [Candidatus Arsenophonus triatominarum]
MDIKEIRRKRLKEWFSDKPLPEKDRSYLSQLINGKSSFGEKAAARIENDYRMPIGYLSNPSKEINDAIIIIQDRREQTLLSLFRELPDSEKEKMLSLFEEKVMNYNKLFNELLKVKKFKK